METLGNLLIGSLLDQAKYEQFALGVRKVRNCAKDGQGKRQTVLDSLEVGVHDGYRQTQTLPGAVFHPSLAQRGPKHIVGDAIEPRQSGAIVLVAETLSAAPCHRKDLGGQIGAIVSYPHTRPREYLTHVAVVELGKCVRIL
jgi:hypothetical protein